MPQKLSSLQIREVSLVDNPANASTDPKTGRKTPHARVALFKRDKNSEVTNIDNAVQNGNKQFSKGERSMPGMTLEQIEKKVTEQDGILKALTDENAVLKAERELVLKMTPEDRRAYAAMTSAEQTEFMKCGDTTKRKEMCDAAMGKMKEKAAEDAMDEACKAEFRKAGPVRRAMMLQEAIAKAEAEADKDKPDDENDDDDSGDDDDMELKDKNKQLQLSKNDIAKNDAELTLLRKNHAEATDRISKAETELAELRKSARLESFTKRAETELPNTAGTPVEKGQDLMQIADAMPGGENGELFRKYMDSLKAADKALTIHFGEIGKSGGENIPAEKALFAKADEIAKRDKIGKGQAMAIAMDENPDLYIAYETSHRRAVHAA